MKRNVACDFALGVLIAIIMWIVANLTAPLFPRHGTLTDQLHRCYERQQVSVDQCNRMHEIVVQWQEMTKP